MKICVYANVVKDAQDRIRTPYGISQFRSYITRHFITSDLPYNHPNVRATEGDIIVWAFRENDSWYLLGDGFVVNKYKENGEWKFDIEGARLYPRSVNLDELSFAKDKKQSLNIGFELRWEEYQELIEKASEPVVR